jgi:hypothetical protein
MYVYSIVIHLSVQICTVCMYICMYVYICIYVCMYVCMYAGSENSRAIKRCQEEVPPSPRSTQ